MNYQQAWIRHCLGGAYSIDLNISHSALGSLFASKDTGAVGQLLAEVRKTFDCDYAFVSTNGTTASNALMLMSAVDEGQTVIVDRGSHSSIHGAITMAGARPVYLPVQIDPDFGLPLPPSETGVDTLLRHHPEACAVTLTTPNYFGRVPPVEGLVNTIHRHGKLALLDAAHGSHLGASSQLPPAIQAARPDLLTLSLHKTLAAMGQASVLIGFDHGRKVRERVQEINNTAPLLSTSFSVPVLLSIEAALHNYRDRVAWDQACDLAIAMRRRIQQIKGCRVVPYQRDEAMSQDPLRVCVDISETGISGYEVAERLAEMGHIAEMETVRHLLFIVTDATTSLDTESLVRCLERALRAPAKHRPQTFELQPPTSLPEMALTPRQALYSRQRRRVRVDEAKGCISAETIATYPPGAPVVVAGEILRREDLEYLRMAKRCGASLKGAHDPEFRHIYVICDQG